MREVSKHWVLLIASYGVILPVAFVVTGGGWQVGVVVAALGGATIPVRLVLLGWWKSQT